MATPALHVMPSPASTEASELDRQIRSAISNYNRSFAHIAYYGWRLKLCDGFSSLGYKDEYGYMCSLGVGRTLWFDAVAVGQALSSLPLAELEKIPVGQAMLLLSVKPEIRRSYPWAEEATRDSYRQLAQKVEERNETVGGPPRVPMTPLSVRVPAAARDSILDSLKKFQDKHELSSIGQALEFAIADKTQDDSHLSALHEALKLLWGVANSLKSHPELETELGWLNLARGRVKQVYKEMLWESRKEEMGDGALYEEEIYETEDAGSDQEDEEWGHGLPEQHGRPQ